MSKVISPSGLLLLLLGLCALLVLAGLAGKAIQGVIGEIALPQVVESDHADLHLEAPMIRECSRQPENILKIFINSSLERFNCAVHLPDGQVGNRVVQWSCRRQVWFEITAYIIGGGSLAELEDVMRAKSCTQVWP